MGPTRLSSLPALDRLGRSDSASFAVVLGSGGIGKSSLLDELVQRCADRGQTTTIVTESNGFETGQPFDGVVTDLVLVDDAHALDAAAAQALLRVASDRSRGFDLCVAMRPASQNPDLGRLVEIAERQGAFVQLGPYSTEELGAALSDHVDGAVDVGLLEAVLELTGGQPLLVDRLITGWVADGNVERGRLVGEPNPAPMAVEHAIFGPINQLCDKDRQLLAALSLLSADDDDVSEQPLAADTANLRGHGLVTDRGYAPRSVAIASLRLLAPDDVLGGERLLAAHQSRTGADPVKAAERFWQAGLAGDHASQRYRSVGDLLFNADPAAAAVWYGRSEDTIETMTLRASAKAAAGDDAGANHDIALVLRRAPEDPVALGACAQLAGRQGRWTDAASLLDTITAHPRWSDSLVQATKKAAVVIGGHGPLVTTISAADPSAAALEQAVRVVQLSMEHIPDTAGLTDAIRSLASRAPSAPVTPDMPINPFELGATIALVAGETQLGSLLLDTFVAPSDSEDAAIALRRWLAVRTGTMLVPDSPSSSRPGSPYVGLLNLASEAALARRVGDVAAGSQILRRLEQVVSLAPIDILTLDAACELLIVARRFGSQTLADTLYDRIRRFLFELENPPLWMLRFLWSQLEAGVATSDLHAVRSAAEELKALGPTGPRLDPLIHAAASWVEVLEERCSLESITAAGTELRDAGHAWEASRLVGQGAIRMQGAADAKQLLDFARELRGQATVHQQEDGRTSSGLSEREIEVGLLILEGHSYKEIGSRLFISAKTVEHHASHIRRKLDTTGMPRAAFLAALRADISS